MSATAVQATSPAILLLIMSGPDKGVTYRLVSQRVTIGRDADNDIVLKDQRCSRHHCVITIQNNQIIAKDVGSKSGIYIQGKKHSEVALNLNDQFQVGDTLLSLRWSGTDRPAPIQAKPQSSPFQQQPGTTQMSGMSAPMARGYSQKKDSRAAFYGVIFVVGALVFFVVTQGPKAPPKDYGLRTEKQIEEDIQNIQKRKSDIFREKMAEGVFNTQAGEAQAAYIQGFRDFRENNFNRAIQSFTAALALNPEHQLAQRYKRLAEKKLDELVQYNLLEGKRAFEQNKYELARSAYRNVLILLNDPQHTTYKEAKERLQEVELLLKGRY